MDKFEKSEGARRAGWQVFRIVFLQMIATSGNAAVGPFYVPATPWPKAGKRGVDVDVSNRKPAFQIIFGARDGASPQTLDFSAWEKRGKFGTALVAAFKKVFVHSKPGTRTVRRIQLNHLAGISRRVRPKISRLRRFRAFDLSMPGLSKNTLIKVERSTARARNYGAHSAQF
ncbi:MAG: hypothetical protein WDN29_01425 [Methylovirgula sp.]